MIKFESVSKVYPTSPRAALADVDVTIGEGEFVFLVGPSGSGKSTFLRLVLREERPTAGKIVVMETDLTRLKNRRVPAMRRQMGVVFQDFRLLPDRNIAANIAFALEVIGRSKDSVKTLVPETLELVGLEGKAQRMPDELSGGEQQRVAIARAYVNRPRLLLADEPTGNLDPGTSVGIMKLLDRINRSGTTVVMATHDSQIVDSMRRRVIELDAGHVVRDQARGVYGYAP
ncbi:MAG: cell division ATP-binding protein FtsE [Frankiaceae bacterium]|jgi:cell division transport system ATP-binding protein